MISIFKNNLFQKFKNLEKTSFATSLSQSISLASTKLKEKNENLPWNCETPHFVAFFVFKGISYSRE